jgi:SAM-dependent methyltransferase
MALNYSFDRRIAAQYEHQRRHPPEVSSAIGAAIANLVGVGGRVLELGVGTGRIARPVATAGCRVIGVDSSAEMIEEVVQPDDSARAVQLVQADISQLPFTGDVFDAVLAVHVLHLVRDLASVLAQATNALQPGGLFIQGRDWVDPESVTGLLRDGMRMEVMKRSPGSKPPAAGASLEDVLATLGGHPEEAEEVVAAEWETYVSPASVLETMANRTHSESWILPDELLAPVLEQLTELSLSTWSDLETPQLVSRRFYVKAIPGNW